MWEGVDGAESAYWESQSDFFFFYPHLTIRGDYLQERINSGELVELKLKKKKSGGMMYRHGHGGSP